MALRMPAKWRSKVSPPLIMRISLIISLFIHFSLIISFQDAFPLYRVQEDLRSYEIEFIRPPVDDLDLEEKGQVDIADRKDESKTPADESEETISLDTDDKRYLSYAQAIKERIMMHWAYPPDARNNLIEGRLLALFSLSKEGVLTRFEITRSSDHEILDREAERAVRNAAPFPPIPDHIRVSRLNIEASFDYHITTKRHVKTE